MSFCEQVRRPRVALLCGRIRSTYDAIFTYSERLAAALSATGLVEPTLFALGPGRSWVATEGPRSEDLAALGFDAYLLQYNPFSYGRWGIAPWLPEAWRALGAGRRVKKVITVHEAHVVPDGLRSALIGTSQRIQLWRMLASSDSAIAVCHERTEQILKVRPQQMVREIPVGSNLEATVDGAQRAAVRERLTEGRDVPIVATFGNAHISRPMRHVNEAIRAIAADAGEVLVLNLGAAPPRLESPPGCRVLTPGALESAELALHLACADLVLLPYIHGAVTNRTALVAALQLGRAVLSTSGPSTDPVLRDPGLRLVDVGDLAGYAHEGVALIRDEVGRSELGRRGRELYDRSFSWRVIASQVLECLEIGRRGPVPSAD